MRHLLRLQGLSKADIIGILDLADRLKAERRAGMAHPVLAGKTLGMIFEKSSTRTRVSFETGIYQLGGQGLFLSPRDLQMGRGEPVRDTARVLSRYLDGVLIRTFSQRAVEEFAEYSSVPVINGLTDLTHPCQVLADLMTIRERRGRLEGLRLCYIGDGNNMANSLIAGGLTCGMSVAVATPVGHRPDPATLEFAGRFPRFLLTDDPGEAVLGADVVCTDVWASMGQEGEAERRRAVFAPYQINDALLARAPGALVLHCLPAHRGEEITDAVFEAHADEIFDEAENRLHVQKAVLALLMG